MKAIAFCNQKGGVGKTTTAIHTAVGLADRGKRVLAVDVDPQSNMSMSLGSVPNMDDVTLMDVFSGDAPIDDALTNVRVGLDLVSIGLEGTVSDMKFVSVGREYLLRDALRAIEGKYDYCIMDTCPSLGVLAINALTAADEVIIPVNLDLYGMQGISQLSGFIQNVQRYTNQSLKIGGVLVTEYKGRAQVSKVLAPVLQTAVDSLGCEVLGSIRKCEDVVKAQTANEIIYDYAPRCYASEDYNKFIDTILANE